MKQSSKTLELHGKKITLETGILAEQATSSVLARMGDTVVLATVVMGREDTKLDYFPLSVDYVERLYAGGRIKGSRWVKREGRPSDDAILTGRLIDRSIRPLFPKALKKDVQVVVNVLSVDGENDPDILGIVAVSAAIATSKIPWSGPIGACRVGVIADKENDGKKEIVINPNTAQYPFLELDMVVSSSAKDNVVMIEAGAKEIREDIALEAVKKAKEANREVRKLIDELVKEAGEKKIELKADESMEEAVMLVEKSYKDKLEALIENGVDKEIGGALDEIGNDIIDAEEGFEDKKKLKDAVDYVFKRTIREKILNEGKRPDGRAVDEVRSISGRVGILPRTHGSAIFQRGQTQALTIATLGSPSMEQLIEGPEGEETKRYIHFYSALPFSFGTTGRIGSPSRREVGHGALAERALQAVIPSKEVFPYTIMVVSEVMSQNGSSSMASTCGSTLALMDAGVPLVRPVAGIAIGLMTNEKKHVVLTDIIGLEDFSGDMDFKIAGTTEGITAIQLDVKLDGLTDEMIAETFERARKARLFILDKMLATLPEARKEVSQYAPKIKTIQINPEKIGEVIGSGGKTIRNISASTGATVDVEEDGTITLTSVDEEAVEKAANWIETMTRDLQPGEVFEGTVKRILPFGAFVELVPGKEGMVHVSEMSDEYVQNPEDVVTIGQTVKVRVKEVDDQGRINLSMRFGERAEEGSNKGERGGDRGRRDNRPRREGGPRKDFNPNRRPPRR
jgi:polyribonucleotide nucleotidyltransferase